jgi:hypothetical protein
MKKYFFYLLLLVFFTHRATFKKHNALMDKSLSVAEQIEDVNYLEKKIEKIQPSLYQFISKEDLHSKFDSVRSTINTSLKPNDFYFKVSPLLASIRQGHASMTPLITEYSKKESKENKKKGIGPVSQFDYKWLDHKLYILKNNSKDSTIQIGTEVVAIENSTPQYLFSKYRKTYTSMVLMKHLFLMLLPCVLDHMFIMS